MCVLLASRPAFVFVGNFTLLLNFGGKKKLYKKLPDFCSRFQVDSKRNIRIIFHILLIAKFG
jgi:hypothetical protein